MKDPYDILGVPKTASEAEIKKAFRTLAKKHHPDKHAGDKPMRKKKFQEISGAYDILGDKDKRAQFDAARSAPTAIRRGLAIRAGGFDPRAAAAVFARAIPSAMAGFGGAGRAAWPANSISAV